MSATILPFPTKRAAKCTIGSLIETAQDLLASPLDLMALDAWLDRVAGWDTQNDSAGC